MAMTLRAKRLATFACHLCGASIITEGLDPFVPITCAKCHEKTRVPVRLGRFLLFRVVESTPGGRLFHGHDEALGRAVRVMVLRDAGSPAAERELRLAQFLSRIPCQGIPRILSLEETEGQSYLVMEYTGLPTAERLVDKQGALSPARALAVASGAARVLRHAAAAGLAHMNLSPTSLLVGPEDETWVRGFSPHNFAQKAPEEGWATAGAPWSAPESRAGDEKPGTLQDMWGLGTVLEFLLAGRPPTSDGHTLEEAGLPAPAVACVRRLCAAQPEGRFSAWDEAVAFLASALEEILRPGAPTEQSMPQVVEPGPARLCEEPAKTADAALDAVLEGSSIVNFDPVDATIEDEVAAEPPAAADAQGEPASAPEPEAPQAAMELKAAPEAEPAETTESEDDFAMDFGALLSAKEAPVETPEFSAPNPEAEIEAEPEAAPAETTGEKPAREGLEDALLAEPAPQPAAESPARALEPEEPALAALAGDAQPEDEADFEEADFEEPVFGDPAFEFDAEPEPESQPAPAAGQGTTPEPVSETLPPPAAAPVVPLAAAQAPVTAEPSSVVPSFENEPPAEADAAKKMGLHSGLSGDTMARLKGLKKKSAAETQAPVPTPAQAAAQPAPTPVAAAPAPAELPAVAPAFENEPPADADAAKKMGLHSGLTGDTMARLKGLKKKPAAETQAPAPTPAQAAAQPAPTPVAAASAPAELPAVAPAFENEPPADADAAKKMGLHSGLTGDTMARLKGFKKKPAAAPAAAEPSAALPITQPTQASQPAHIEPEVSAPASSTQKNRMQAALAKLKGGAGAAAFKPATPAAPAADAVVPAAAEEAPATLPEVALPMETPAESGDIKKMGLHSGLSGDQMAKLRGLKKK